MTGRGAFGTAVCELVAELVLRDTPSPGLGFTWGNVGAMWVLAAGSERVVAPGHPSPPPASSVSGTNNNRGVASR